MIQLGGRSCITFSFSLYPYETVRLIKMCLTETYSRVMFPVRNGLKQGDALSSLLLNFALEYAIRRVPVNQDDLKFKGINQRLVYSDDVNTLGGSNIL